MQSRFGLKDFVVVALLLIVLASLWLAMHQRDREWSQIQEIKSKLPTLEQQLARVERAIQEGEQGRPDLSAIEHRLEEIAARLDRGVVVSGTQADEIVSRDAQRPEAPWARPGVPIAWQASNAPASDPASVPGFAPGGEFTEIFDVQPAKLTPFVQTDVYGRRAIDLVSETLAGYDPATLKLRGVLADAWQADPNGLWLRVHINPRARFSDGVPVTAEDVRWTFHDFVFNPQIEAERARSIIADVIERVEVVDEHTIEFTFKGAFFSNLVSAMTQHILPKHFYGTLTPVQINQGTGLLMGSGPYKLARLDANNQWAPPAPIELVRSEQYWGAAPALDTVRFFAITDEQARLNAYKAGEASMIQPSPTQWVAATTLPDWEERNLSLRWSNMRSGRGGIIWNCATRLGRPTPFGDKRVRQAMTMLLDREKVVRDIYHGTRMVAKGYFNPGTPGDRPEVAPWPYDPTRAMALLAEAGWIDRDNDRVLENERGDEFVFEFTYFTGGETTERLALFVKDAYAAAGIRCTLRSMDWSVGDTYRNTRDFDAMLMGWGANDPESDPKQIFHSASIQDQGDNFGQWSNPEADAAIDLARKELDPVRRAELWREVDRIMHEEQPYTWVTLQPWLRFVSKEYANVNPYPKGLEYAEFVRLGPSGPANP